MTERRRYLQGNHPLDQTGYLLVHLSAWLSREHRTWPTGYQARFGRSDRANGAIRQKVLESDLLETDARPYGEWNESLLCRQGRKAKA